MTKKEVSLTIELQIERFESSQSPFEEKRVALEEIIDLCRLFKEEFRADYKNKFIGNTTTFSGPFLDELEKLVEFAYNNKG